MAAVMLSVNERAGALLSGIDVQDEPLALGASESPIFELPDGRSVTIAASPVFSPVFKRYCAMMRRSDLLNDPRFATASLRKLNLAQLYGEVRAWVLSFTDLDQLQAQVSESGLAVGQLRTLDEFADSEWAREWGAVVDVDDRAGGSFRMPGAPWHFSKSRLPAPGIPHFRGESNEEVLSQLGLTASAIDEFTLAGILKKDSSSATVATALSN
jgi:crotonobetainyl-CoA:carnitine CoA-transferase CaiB-like acyl-CoA transferase